MNSIYKIFFFLAFLTLLNQITQAASIAGGEIKWEHLSTDKYKITVTAYRDCNGNGFSNSPINFSGSCAGITQSSQSMSPGRDITPVCPNQCSRCKSKNCSFKYGIEEYVLTTTIDVSTFKKNGCCWIDISWTQNARGPGITTGAASNRFYIKAKMNICQSVPDNSPSFSSEPISFVCLGRDFVKSFEAKDPDSDSLFYSFTDPLVSSGQKTPWKSPYYSTKPLSYLGFPKDYAFSRFPFGIHLNSSTGQFAFRPMQLEQTVVAIKVEEYRNGKKIGETTRDVQITVIKCPNNNQPIISGIDCSNTIPANFTTTACLGQDICFDICTSDKDGDSVKINWDSGIKGATFTISNKKDRYQKARFCWTPTEADLKSSPHTFTVYANDNACPMNGFGARIFTIVVGKPDSFGINTKIYPPDTCGNSVLVAESKDSIPRDWDWYVNDQYAGSAGKAVRDSNNYTFTKNDTHFIEIHGRSAFCPSIFYDTIVVSHLNPISLQPILDTVICGDLNLVDSFNGWGGYGKLKYQWSQWNGPNDSNNIIKAIAPNSSAYGYSTPITYSAIDSLGCRTDSTFNIITKPNVLPNLQNDTTFCGDSVLKKLKVFSPNGNWSGPNVKNNIFSNQGLPDSQYVLHYFEEDSFFCATDSVVMNVQSRTKIDAGKDLNACARMDQPFQLVGKPTGGIWLSDLVPNSGVYRPDLSDTGSYNAVYQYTNSHGCISMDSMNIKILSYKVSVDAGVDSHICVNDTSFELKGQPANGIWSYYSYVHKSGNGYIFNGEKTIPGVRYPVFYKVIDSIGCYNFDTLHLTSRGIPTVSVKDTHHCFYGQDTVLLKGKPLGGIWKGKGLFGTSNQLIIDSSYIGTSVYNYSLTNQFGCSNYGEMSLSIRNKPQVYAGPDDTICQSAASQYRFAPNVLGGQWSGPFVSNPIAPFVMLPTGRAGIKTYTYRYTDEYGCKNADSLNLVLSKRSNAAFRASTQKGQAPLTVNFSNLSYNADFYHWDFGNGDSSSQKEPSILYQTEGTYEVVLTTSDSLGLCKSVASKTIVVDKNVNIGEINKSSFQVYPNPASSILHIKTDLKEEVTLVIYNALGQEQGSFTIAEYAQLNIEGLSPGVYQYRVITNNGDRVLGKFVVE